MNVEQIYQKFKAENLNRHVDTDGYYGAQCVDVYTKYAQYLFPGTNWRQVCPPVQSAWQIRNNYNPTYFEWIPNDHNDPNQLPQVGDIGVSDPTPAKGYQATFVNPDGHTWIFDQVDKSGYTALQQDGSNPAGSVFLGKRPWKYRPVTGWLRPKVTPAPNATPAPAPAAPAAGAPANTVFLPGHVQSWAAYRVGSGLRKGTNDQVATLSPAKYGGLRYAIVSRRSNSVVIDTQMFGRVEIWVKDTDAQIS